MKSLASCGKYFVTHVTGQQRSTREVQEMVAEPARAGLGNLNPCPHRGGGRTALLGDDFAEAFHLLFNHFPVADNDDQRTFLLEVLLRHLRHLLRRDGIHLLHVGAGIRRRQAVEIHVVQLIRDAAAARVLKDVGPCQVVLNPRQLLRLRGLGGGGFGGFGGPGGSVRPGYALVALARLG